jgi:NarL family two-component system response regulator LiaR
MDHGVWPASNWQLHPTRTAALRWRRRSPRCNLPHVRKTVLVYGLLGGVLIAALQLIQYRFLVVERSLEIYGGLVALVFSALGIWLGLKLTRVREVPVIPEVVVEVPVLVQVGAPFQRNETRVAQLGITPRELEVLEAVAAGLSTREIGERLFVSENTVKTHTARLFDKLSARRRTQAVQRAKAEGLIT